MNKHIFTGNVGSVKEPAKTKNSEVLNFTVATNSYYTKGEEKVQETTWIECALWNRPNVFPYIKPGTPITICGKPEATAYIDKDGKAVGVLRCTVDEIEFSSKKEKETTKEKKAASVV